MTQANTVLYMATNATLVSWTNDTENTSIPFANGQAQLGAGYWGCFNGLMDEVAIYNQTLTREQIGGILSASLASTLTAAMAPVLGGSAGGISMSGGHFSVGGTGTASQAYVLYQATNLISPVWTPVFTNVADTNGMFRLTDPNALNNNSAAFYRAGRP